MAFSVKSNTVFKTNVPSDLVSYNVMKESISTTISMIIGSNPGPELNEIGKMVSSYCIKFADKFYNAMLRVRSHEYRDFEKVCKRRSGDLDQLFKLLSTTEGGAQLYLSYSPDKTISSDSITYLGSNATIFAYFEGKDDNEIPWIYSLEQRPRFYQYLILPLIRVMALYNVNRDIDKDFAKSLLELSQIPLSLGRVYQELRATEDMILEDENASLKRMRTEHHLDHQSEFIQLFNDVAQDIKKGSLPYIKDVSYALYRTKDIRNAPFCNDDIYISAKGTSSFLAAPIKRYCSIVSSLFETDKYVGNPLDEKIGYQSFYNVKEAENYHNPGFRTIAIPQHKIKYRVIVITDNPLQDRCNYIHRRLQKFLEYIPSDCTLHQHNGVLAAIDWTKRSNREAGGMYDILCNDIVDATGTLNQEFQKMCLELVLPPECAEFWDKYVAKGEKTFYHNNGEKETYIQKSGQPQGVIGSFDAFAWAHHVIFLMVMKKCGLENVRAQNCYMVLGDDSIAISVKGDPDGIFQQTYINIAKWVNWEIELSKSHIIRHTDIIASAEFAKVTVVEGRVITPIPIRLFSRCGLRKTNYYYFSTIIWMMCNGYESIQDQIDSLVKKQYPDENDHRIIMTILRGALIKQFKHLDSVEFSQTSLDRSLLRLAILTSQIKGSFIEALLNDKQREALQLKQFEIKDSLSLLLDPEIENLINKVENPNHKYWDVLQRNSIIEDSLKVILETPNTSIVKALITLTPAQEMAILNVTNIIENLESSFTESEGRIIDSLSSELDVLDGFQLRSLHKAATRQASYFDDILRYIKKFCITTSRDINQFLLPNLIEVS